MQQDVTYIHRLRADRHCRSAYVHGGGNAIPGRIVAIRFNTCQPAYTACYPDSGAGNVHHDGSVIETDGTEFAISPASGTPAPNAATPGHGIWEPAPVPGSLYVQYISMGLQADGALYAKNITTMVVTLNTAGNQFTGSYQTVQALPAGTTKVLASGKVSGQLIPHNPLP